MSLAERLETLEAMLLAAAEEVSVTRRALAVSSIEQGRDVAAGEEHGLRAPPVLPRAAAPGRARLRESPVGDLFRSTAPSAPADRDPFGAVRSGSGGPESHARLDPLSAERPGSAVRASRDQDPTASRRNEADLDTGPWLDHQAARIEPRRARMLDNSESLLGPEHPDTLWAAHDLAYALLKGGELAAASRLAARLVRVRTRLSGPQHAHTLRARELQARAAEHRNGPR